MNASDTSPMVTQLDGEPVEIKISLDMVKRGLLVAPAIIAICALIWGVEGAYSAAFAIGLVLVLRARRLGCAAAESSPS